MATIHSYLRKQGDEAINGTETVRYGPSTNNKVYILYCLVCVVINFNHLVFFEQIFF